MVLNLPPSLEVFLNIKMPAFFGSSIRANLWTSITERLSRESCMVMEAISGALDIGFSIAGMVLCRGVVVDAVVD